MEKKKFKEILEPALKFSAVLGTLGGFIGDVLSPLGPYLSYLLYISLFVLIISVVLLLLLPTGKKDLFKTLSFSSLFFALIFGGFNQLNEETDSGFFAENIEFVSDFQSNLNIIDAKLEKISGQINEVDKKITGIDNKLDEEFDNLSSLIKSSNPISNPSTPKDFLINAYLFRNGGDLDKSEESFTDFFESVGSYKIDVLADFIDVMKSNKGEEFVKSYFKLRNVEDDVFKLFKTIYTSEDESLNVWDNTNYTIEKIKKLDIDKSLIDFGIVHLTNNYNYWSTWNMVDNDSEEYIKFLMMYHSYAIILAEYDIRLKSNGIKKLKPLIINIESFNKLIQNELNPNNESFIETFFKSVEDLIDPASREDSNGNEIIETEKKAFLNDVTPSILVTISDDEYEKMSRAERKDYHVVKFGEKFYLYDWLPRDDGERIWLMYNKYKDSYR
tara:strand:+ start:75 stop:1406 length:1332 start_codon:yes stop_codon:yes gene_type:complete